MATRWDRHLASILMAGDPCKLGTHTPCTCLVCRGFQLLVKMGYKAGEGIGRDGRGRAAPISVDLKAGRTGLGVDEDRKRKQHSYKQLQELRSMLCLLWTTRVCASDHMCRLSTS